MSCTALGCDRRALIHCLAVRDGHLSLVQSLAVTDHGQLSCTELGRDRWTFVQRLAGKQ